MTARQFQKKPIRVFAYRYDGTNSAEIVEWADDDTVHSIPDGPDADLRRPDGELLIIHTLEGQLYASVGDWIIQGIHGEFYPCKPDIFEKTYSEVTA